MIPEPMTANRISQIKGMSSVSYDLTDEVWEVIQDCTAEIDRLRLENHQLRVAQSIIERECDTRRHILPPGITADDLRAELDDLESHAVRWAEGGRFVCIRVCVDHLLSLLEPGEKKA